MILSRQAERSRRENATARLRGKVKICKGRVHATGKSSVEVVVCRAEETSFVPAVRPELSWVVYVVAQLGLARSEQAYR